MRSMKSLRVSALFYSRRTGLCAPNTASCVLYHSLLRVSVCVSATSQCTLPPPLHVYVRIHHTPPEDGCKLYQPYERKEKGSIGIGLVREMLEALSDTSLGNWLVDGREDLVGQRGGTAFYDRRKPPSAEGNLLNGDHTHFLLVDNGTEGRDAWGSEVQFRAALEKELAALDRSSTLVLLVIGGGPGTMNTVLATAEAGLPIILLTDTGGAATAIGEFLAGGIDKVERRLQKPKDQQKGLSPTYFLTRVTSPHLSRTSYIQNIQKLHNGRCAVDRAFVDHLTGCFQIRHERVVNMFLGV